MGVEKEIIQDLSGKYPQNGHIVSTLYSGIFTDGRKVSSPLKFKIGVGEVCLSR